MLTPFRFIGFLYSALMLLSGPAYGQAHGHAREEAGAATHYDPASDSLRFAGEVHLRNIRQLTFGGNNAEAYWSRDDSLLVFQSDWDRINPQGCDQQFVMRAEPAPAEAGGTPLSDSTRYRLVSTGEGRTTCGYFLLQPDAGPAGRRVLFASTHAAAPRCPEPVRFAEGRYVWPIYAGYDLYTARADGADVRPLITGPGYDAEATVSPDGRYVVFTSTRSGDLELWRYNLQTGDLLQLTDALGYDGGAFFSPDSKRIVWRASRPTGEEADVYRELLADGLVEPKALDLYIANADGTDAQRVTRLPGANWAPFFHPSGERILFASNHHMLDEGGRVFDLFLIGVDGAGLEQVTHSGTFDAFPMFSFDGKRLVFASNRNTARQESRDTNLFVADWVEEPEDVDRAFEPVTQANSIDE